MEAMVRTAVKERMAAPLEEGLERRVQHHQIVRMMNSAVTLDSVDIASRKRVPVMDLSVALMLSVETVENAALLRLVYRRIVPLLVAATALRAVKTATVALDRNAVRSSSSTTFAGRSVNA